MRLPHHWIILTTVVPRWPEMLPRADVKREGMERQMCGMPTVKSLRTCEREEAREY